MQSITPEKDVPFWQKTRYRISFLVFCGNMVLITLRFNISVALVDMVKISSSAAKTQSQCVSNVNRSQYIGSSAPKFDWDANEQGLLLGSFFYTYVVTQPFGGYFADKYSPVKFYGYSIGVSSLLSILTPLSTKLGFGGLFGLRLLLGCSSGFAMAAPAALFARWAPPDERGKLAGMAFCGFPCGLMISQPLIGALTQTFGWDIQFYVVGLLCFLWFPVWIFYVRDKPSQMESWKISQDEKQFLSQFKIKRSKHTVPWKNILISLPVWGLIISWFSMNYLFYGLVSMLPTYLSNVHGQDILTSGGLASLPHLSIGICSLVQASLASYLKQFITQTTSRRLFQSVGTIVPAILLLSITPLECNTTAVVVIICTACFFQGFVYGGVLNPNVIDLSPPHAGTLMGFCCGISNLAGFVAPQLTGALISGNEFSIEGWESIWSITSFISIAGGIIYALVASAEIQPWSSGPMNMIEQLKFEGNQIVGYFKNNKVNSEKTETIIVET